LRALGLPPKWQLACILPAAVISLIVGELVASWPNVTLFATAGQAWLLAACCASLAVGAMLSYLSLPTAYRARAW
jgi:hypothetical protein